MSKNLYLTTTGPTAGKSAIVLGLMSFLEREIRKVGYFRPIARTGNSGEIETDRSVKLICDVYGLECNPDLMIGVPERQAMDMITAGKYDELLDEILIKYKRYEAQRDFVLIEGTNYQGATTAFEFDVNADIARNLGAPVLLVVSGRERTAADIFDNTVISKEQFDEHDCDLMGVIANRVDADQLDQTRATLTERFATAGIQFMGAIPEEDILAKPRMDEVAEALGAEVVYGKRYLDNLVYSFSIASMQLDTLLERVGPGSLVISSGDRADILLGMMASQLSNRMPKIAGILLTSGFKPTETVDQLIKGLRGVHIPVLAVETGTYQTSINVNRVISEITPHSYRKIETSQVIFDEHVDHRQIRSGITALREDKITPKLFLYKMMEKAGSDLRHIVLPEGGEERILRAAGSLLRRGVVKLTLLGDADEIRHRAEKVQVDLEGATLINPAESEWLEDFSSTYAELRKHKGVSLQQAHDTMIDPTYFGTMMVHKGHADGMVSGSINTTAHTVRPAFEFIKTKPGISLVSSVFFMCLADRVLVYGDCAVNPNPTAEQLAQIAVSSAETAAAFGVSPRVAMLSYATGKSGTGEDVELVTEATRLARELRPDLAIEGPLQYDAAVDAGVAKTKMPESSVAGRATVFIFPDLNTGNNTYKAVQRSANAVAVGPVLQGLNKPVNDLSRGCTVTDIVNTVVITAIQAQAE